jgi:hypothetical protein
MGGTSKNTSGSSKGIGAFGDGSLEGMAIGEVGLETMGGRTGYPPAAVDPGGTAG